MPSRRQVLAAIPPFLAGCTSSPSVNRPTRTATATPPETIDDCRTTPEPPSAPTRAEAREFVAAHEEALVYNWLVAQNGGPSECRPDGPGSQVSSEGTGGPTDVDVESARTAVVAGADDGGHYLVSACSGRAEYWCHDQGRACSGAGRNSHFVTHFVGDGRHRRVPHNWLVCHVRDDPYRAPDADANLPSSEDDPGLTFRVYPFREDAAADVTLTHLGTGERVLSETYSPNAGPAVQTGVTVATGDYELVAETDDGRISYVFSLTGRDDPAWNGLCLYVGPDDLRVVEVATDGDLAVPESTLCSRRRDAETENGESDS